MHTAQLCSVVCEQVSINDREDGTAKAINESLFNTITLH